MEFKRIDMTDLAQEVAPKRPWYAAIPFLKKEKQQRFKIANKSRHVKLDDTTRVVVDHVPGTRVVVKKKGMTYNHYDAHQGTNRYGIVLDPGKYTLEVKRAT